MQLQNSVCEAHCLITTRSIPTTVFLYHAHHPSNSRHQHISAVHTVSSSNTSSKYMLLNYRYVSKEKTSLYKKEKVTNTTTTTSTHAIVDCRLACQQVMHECVFFIN